MFFQWKITCLAAQNLKQYVIEYVRLVTAFNNAVTIFMFAFQWEQHDNIQHLSQNCTQQWHFILLIFSFKVLNKQKTPEKIIEPHLHKNALINDNLKLDISNDNICQGLLFIHSQSTTISIKIAKVDTVIVWSLHVWVALQPLPGHLSEIPSLSVVLACSCSDLVPSWGACSSLALSQDSIPRVFSLLKGYGHAKWVVKQPSPTNNQSYQ